MSEVGRFYNLIREQSHQLTMKLTSDQMWDHNGTYMSGLGFMYQKHKIVAEVGEDDNLAGEHHSLWGRLSYQSIMQGLGTPGNVVKTCGAQIPVCL